MKFDRNKTFPYPVLRPYSDDYNDVEFQATVEFVVSKDKIIVNVGYAISSKEIATEIINGNAEFVATVGCRDTYFQHVLRSTDMNASAEFDIGELRGEVRVNPYIAVKKDIPAFSSQDINDEFGDKPFSFSIGDVLAQDDAQIFYIDRDLLKPITSVFDLVKKDGQSDDIWTISFDDDHIQIVVSPKMKESIDAARNSPAKRAVLMNSIYFSAVMQAIQKLQNEETRATYSDKKWVQVFERSAHNKGIDINSSDAYLVAEHLMSRPIKLLESSIFKAAI